MKEEEKLTRLLRRRKQLKMAECRLSRCSFEMRKGWAELYRVLFTPCVLTTEIDTNTRGHSTPAVVILTQIELMEFDTAYLTLGNSLCVFCGWNLYFLDRGGLLSSSLKCSVHLWCCSSLVVRSRPCLSLPGPYRDLDHSRELCHSSCPLHRPLVLTPRLSGFSYQVIPLVHLTRSAFEQLTVTLSIKIYIVVIYRPPSTTMRSMPFSATFEKMAHLSLSWVISTSCQGSCTHLK